MIKFMKYYVTDGKTKARVWYHVGMDRSVAIYEKDYEGNLSKILDGVVNGSDIITDLFCKDHIRLQPGQTYYDAAMERAQINKGGTK